MADEVVERVYLQIHGGIDKSDIREVFAALELGDRLSNGLYVETEDPVIAGQCEDIRAEVWRKAAERERERCKVQVIEILCDVSSISPMLLDRVKRELDALPLEDGW